MLGFRKKTEPKIGGHVIVVGNEKGGSGKSTTAMHLIVAMLQSGRSVCSIDVDARQGTLSRYISNRDSYIKAANKQIKMPEHYTVDVSRETKGDKEATDELKRLELMIEGAYLKHDVVVIDTPGSASALSRLAHSYADTLVTPINDSLVDLDVLGHVDPRKMTIMGPSHYSEMVWEQKKNRATRDGGSIDWIVMRNRLSNLDSHNNRDVERLVSDLGNRIRFRTISGFTERVIFRELFLVGLTILDLKEAGGAHKISASHHAAREEIRMIVDAIQIDAPVQSSVKTGT